MFDDREAIKDLVLLYALYSDTGRFSETPALFTDDAVLDESAAGQPRAVGKEQITQFMEYAESFTNGEGDRQIEFGLHFTTNHIITDLTENKAKGVSNLLFEGRMRNGIRLRLMGSNEDEYRRVDGKWLFSARCLTIFGEPEGFDQLAS